MRGPTPQQTVQRVVAAYGGAEKLSAAMNAGREESWDAWQQDPNKIGRVLRAHLVVEHILNEYVRAIRPAWSQRRVTEARFANKVAFLSRIDPMVRLLSPGFTRLNLIRKRLAHDLAALVSEDDKDEFLSIHFFKAWHDETHNQRGKFADDPVSIVEEFAQLAVILLKRGDCGIRGAMRCANG